MQVKKKTEPGEIIWVTAKYLTLAGILIWVLYNPDTVLTYIQKLLPGVKMEVSQMIKPVLVLLGFFYSASLGDKILYGTVVEVLCGGLQKIGLTSSFFIFIQPFDFLKVLNPVVLFLLLTSIISTLINISRLAFVKINEMANPLLGATQVVSTGILLLHAWSVLETDVIAVFHEVIPFPMSNLMNKADILIIISTGILALQSILQIVKDHPNPQISFIARKLGEKTVGRILALNLMVIYLLSLRPIILDTADKYSRFLPLGEWIIICLVFYHLYTEMKSYISSYMITRDEVGVWTKHIQSIEFKTSRDMDEITNAIENFIEKGEKKELIVRLTLLLSRAGLTAPRITYTLSEILRHRDKEAGILSFTWQVKQLQEKNKQRRKEVTSNILEALSEKRLITRPTDYSDREILDEEPMEVYN